MKISNGLFLIICLGQMLLSQVSAQVTDYKNPKFQACYKREAKYIAVPDAIARCEEYERQGIMDLILSPEFNEWYVFASKFRAHPDAMRLSLDLYQRGLYPFLSTDKYKGCYDLYSSIQSSPDAMNTCIKHYQDNSLDLFFDANFKECFAIYSQSSSVSDTISTCMKKFRSPNVLPSGLTIQQVAANIQTPQGAQIIIKNEFEMPGKETCVALKNGEREVKCWVCRQDATSKMDVLYRLPVNKEKDMAEARITPIVGTRLSQDGREMIFKLENDGSDSDNLDSVICRSKVPFQIKNRSELQPIFESNGMGFSLPAPKIK